MARTRRRWLSLGPSVGGAAAAALVVLGALSVVSRAHPDLQLVDVVAFSGRAERLLAGGTPQDLLSPRYPLGYPALLGLVKEALGDVRLAARVLSVGAGVLAAAVAGRWLGVVPALLLAGTAPFLAWGAAEGTDLPALAMALWALALATPPPGAPRGAGGARALVVGLAAGTAAMMRYPAALVLPVAVVAATLSAERRGRALVGVLVGAAVATGPHWGAALAGMGPLLPDPAENAAIGASGPAPVSVDGWLAATGRALSVGLSPWVAKLGLVGLLVGAARRDGRALALLAWGVLHVALLGLFFANDRLCLPVTAAATLGVAFLMDRLPEGGWGRLGRVAAAAGAAVLLGLGVQQARAVDAAEAARAEWNQVVAGEPGPLAASSPWVHLHRGDGWVEPALLLKEATPGAVRGGPPPRLGPAELSAWAREEGVVRIFLDNGRVQRTYPGLRPLMARREGARYADGLVLLERGQGWRLFAVQDPAAASPASSSPEPSE